MKVTTGAAQKAKHAIEILPVVATHKCALLILPDRFFSMSVLLMVHMAVHAAQAD